MAGVLFAAVLAIVAVFTSLHDWERPPIAPKIAKQEGAEKLVIQELDDLYGPSSEDFLPTLQDTAVVTEAKISHGDDTVLDWFEVEDETTNLLL